MLKKIACSSYNAAAVSPNGDLYLWGSARTGLLGKDCTNPQVFTFESLDVMF